MAGIIIGCDGLCAGSGVSWLERGGSADVGIGEFGSIIGPWKYGDADGVYANLFWNFSTKVGVVERGRAAQPVAWLAFT